MTLSSKIREIADRLKEENSAQKEALKKIERNVSLIINSYENPEEE